MNRQSRLKRIDDGQDYFFVSKNMRHMPYIRATYVNKGKVYPYASTKRGGKK